MGLDLVDLTLRLEKRFGVRIEIEDWLRRGANGPNERFDVTAGEVWNLVESKLGKTMSKNPLPMPVDEAAGESVPILNYASAIPSSPASGPDARWAEVRVIIAAVVSVPVQKVQHDALLKRDLGASW